MNQRVGIRTATPTVELDVNGDIRVANGSDFYIGNIGLDDTGAGNTTSGASQTESREPRSQLPEVGASFGDLISPRILAIAYLRDSINSKGS